MSLSDAHTRLYIACTLYSFAVGVWALYLSIKDREIDSNFWGALAINEILFVVVGLLDLVFWLNGGIAPERPFVHLLYTATGALIIPATYTFTRGRATSREAAIYTACCLFLAGIAIRAIVTTTV